MNRSTLFYIIGPSGSGKDSVIRYARERLTEIHGLLFAHRYITRPVELNGENHIALTEAEFEVRLKAGLFAMHWESHGFRYALGREIDIWLASGCNVVINGSRAYLAQARRQYPSLQAILITAPPELLATRLRHRGRETEAQIVERIRRAAAFDFSEEKIEIIWNKSTLEMAGQRLIQLLLASTRPTK